MFQVELPPSQTDDQEADEQQHTWAGVWGPDLVPVQQAHGQLFQIQGWDPDHSSFLHGAQTNSNKSK